MNNSSVLQILKKIFDDSQILTDEPMKNHTSFKIGGMADFVVQPNSTTQISNLIKKLIDEPEEVPIFILGNGSNLLVSDNGIRGIVVKICEKMNTISVSDTTLTCQSGALLSAVASFALKNSLGGFEFAAGIPGTLGGAVVMNAGAYGGEIKDVVISTEYINEKGQINETTQHDFGYRRSIFSGKRWIATESKILLFNKNTEEIKSKMKELSQRRRDKQPLDYCSAGSTFKRPEGYFAGKLISDAGLRGYKIGGAAVSTKHCGFIINENNATFEDVVNLIEHVQSVVQKKFGVYLETEVKICDS